ncbi:ABC transporter ATP-binding protein [Pedobacter sp. SYSU D00535]|uniref:ABC transporter ATP-binding protein n=1 Tax=Pedobacter sp. SYSU D00535 TaxID=2810308 RepID=UPI001A95655B|nr:ATP-binding cassette domain-containing protein [Pedobacter sp. SYSU D00535]
MIRISSVSHHYNNSVSFNFPDWNIGRGEQWVLLGESGKGKTTLLHILIGILQPKEGEVLILDQSLYKLKKRNLDKFRGEHVGVVLQQPHLLKSLTVWENLQLAQSFSNIIDKRRIEDVLESVGLSEKRRSYPQELSQGQLQRVSIARAVINKPVLVVADEPTSSLDDRNTEKVLTLLKRQTELHQAALVVATHDRRVKEAFINQYRIA